MVMATPRPSKRCIIALSLVALTAIHSCGGYDFDDEPETSFMPLSPEEMRARATIIQQLASAESLLQDERLTGESRERLRQSIEHVRNALNRFMELRERGHTQNVVIMTLGSASAGVAADDVTVIGVADDWLLVPLAIGVIATKIITDASPTRNELADGWYLVGLRMKILGEEIHSVSQTIGQGTAAHAIPRPVPAEPADIESQPKQADESTNTVDLLPPLTQSVPAPKETERRKRKECIPRSLCPHKGFDDWHNYCADDILGNEFPTCDVVVNNIAFDAKSGNTLYEVKTDDWDTYAEFLVERTLKSHSNTAIREKAAAESCGYEFVFVVGDKTLQTELARSLSPLDIVRHEPRCNRKPYKKGREKTK